MSVLGERAAALLARLVYDGDVRRARQRLRRLRQPARLGSLRRLHPLSEHWGNDRGSAIDRYYIESFLAEHARDIHGHALEVLDSRYIDRFGEGVSQVDVLDIDETNQRATIHVDLAKADAIPADTFDAIVLTQTLQLIYDVHGAVDHLARMLKPGGVLLATMPGITRTGRREIDIDCWRVTPVSAAALFGDAFGEASVAIRSYGNMLSAISFLAGMAREELSQAELEFNDPHYPVIVAVRAQKAAK